MGLSWRTLHLFWALLPGPAFSMEPGSPLRGSLTLDRALELALAVDPEVAAARHEAKAWAGAAHQARLPDNPGFGLEVENLDARGVLADENQVITTRITQILDPGRLSRANVAGRERQSALMEIEAAEKRVRARIRIRFVSLQAAQERISLSGDLVSLAEKAHALAAEKVLAGKAPPTDSLQSFMALTQARMGAGKAADELALARRNLASALGAAEANFDSAQGRMARVQDVPAWESVAARIPASPDWRRSGLAAESRKAEIRSEKFARIPPVTLEAGIRHVPEKDGRAFVAGISLPVPVWNRNQGGIRAAESRRAKAEQEGIALRLDLVERASNLHSRASISHREATAISGNILPAATATFEGVQEAYRLGKFGSLDVLNAQRSLFDAKIQYLSALAEHHSAMAELEETAGGPFPSGDPDRH